MEVETIQRLMSAFKEAELSKLKLKCDDFELQLEKQIPPVMQAQTMMAKPDLLAVQTTTQTVKEEKLEEKKLIKSPMVGTFYRGSSPEAAPFVTVGSHVKKGDIVCVIEAMKLMNEIEAEADGEIVEILVQNEEMVEYNEPLFVIK